MAPRVSEQPAPPEIEDDDGGGTIDGGGESEFDRAKYVSHAEYLRDMNNLKHKWPKIATYAAIGFAVAVINLHVIHFLENDRSLWPYIWQFCQAVGARECFAYDIILAYIACAIVLIVPGVWIGLAKHKYYTFVYFGGFTAASIVYMALSYLSIFAGIPFLEATFSGFFLIALYGFIVSFFMLLVLYLVFYRIWGKLKMNIAVKRHEDGT